MRPGFTLGVERTLPKKRKQKNIPAVAGAEVVARETQSSANTGLVAGTLVVASCMESLADSQEAVAHSSGNPAAEGQ